MLKWLLAEPPNVGEVWRDKTYSNPFTEEGKVAVQAVKDGWVQFQHLKYVGDSRMGDYGTYHTPIRPFRAGYKLIGRV